MSKIIEYVKLNPEGSVGNENNYNNGKIENFIHLRVRSSYSLSCGAIKIEETLDLAEKMKMPAVSITDEGNLFGILEFAMEARKRGIQPIIGCICNYLPDSSAQKQTEPVNTKTMQAKKFGSKILLIATNEQGTKNLLKLISNSYLVAQAEYGLNLITQQELSEHNEGLILLSGYTDGPIGQALLENNSNLAESHINQLSRLFKGRFFMEIMRHNTSEQLKIEDKFINLAYKFNIPLVATNDVYFKDINMHEAHNVLLSIAEGSYINSAEKRRVSSECYFKSASHMERLFRDLPEAIENTVLVAKCCRYMPTEQPPNLPNFSTPDKSEADILQADAEIGLNKRLEEKFARLKTEQSERKKIKEQYFQRLKYELDIIINMKFPGYFLIVADFIKWSKNNNIPVGPARGSGAGSIVAWSLFITELDPIKFGLIFERFLNPERVSMPDFDIDFCAARREEVLEYVVKKYGTERVAQIITFGKLQAKAAIRDVGRVLQIPYGVVDKISKLIPFNAVNPVTLASAIEMVPELKAFSKNDEQISRMLKIALKLEGLNRHASTHAAGIIISADKLIDVVPIFKDEKSEMSIIQYSMKYAEAAGLVKFDFLGLKTLTVIDKTLKLILLNEGKVPNLNCETFDDPSTFEMLSQGKAHGVFQFESGGMQDSLKKLQPDSIEDLIALGALYRPGPMENIPTYIACKHKRQKPNFLHPALKDLLTETFGVIIYQEQVLKIAQIIAGYSLGSADILRKAMGKKIKAEMDAQREVFTIGAKKIGLVSEKQASEIFDNVAKFAGYGFNKSHAAAYAVLSYHTAYLKANFAVEFFVVSMNLEINDTDKINLFVQDAQNFGIKINKPNINESKSYFSVSNVGGVKSINFALGCLKNIGVNAISNIVDEKETNGKYKNIFDFLKRNNPKDINKKTLEHLAKSGALDEFNYSRNTLVNNIEQLLRYCINYHQTKNSNQLNLFESIGSEDVANLPKLTNYAEYCFSDLIGFEFDAFGFFLHHNPLKPYVEQLNELNITNYGHIHNELKEGEHSLNVAGTILNSKSKVSPRGRYIIAAIADTHSTYNVTIYDDEIIATGLIENKTNIVANIIVRKDSGGVRINVRKLWPMQEYFDLNGVVFYFHLYVNGAAELMNIKEYLLLSQKQKHSNHASQSKIIEEQRAAKSSFSNIKIYYKPTAEAKTTTIILPNKYDIAAIKKLLYQPKNLPE